MSVFLRWGVFGIIAFAALMYAYNTGKRVSERREARAATSAPAPASESNSSTPSQSSESYAPVDYGPPVPDECAAELAVAKRAREAHNQKEPYDRVLRMQEIVFAEERRKRRLETIANYFYYMENEPQPADMNRYVNRYCYRSR